MAQAPINASGGTAPVVKARIRRDHAAAFAALAAGRGLTVSELIRAIVARELELAALDGDGRAPPGG